jgi:hypothetical protein
LAPTAPDFGLQDVEMGATLNQAYLVLKTL